MIALAKESAVKKSIFITILSFFLLFVGFSSVVFSKEESSTSAQTKTVARDYQFPYPGLLPDSRFYFLKTFRDNIIGMLISDPLKKAEFNLLQADKRVGASVSLLKKPNTDYVLVISTISKGQNYYEFSIAKIIEAEEQGEYTKNLLNTLQDAAGKHVLVLSDMKKKMPSSYQASFKVLQQRTDTLQKRVDEVALRQ